MDCRGIAPEDYEYMMNAFVDEGLTSLKDYMKEEGIDLRKNPVEFGTYHILPEGKIWINEKGKRPSRGSMRPGTSPSSASVLPPPMDGSPEKTRHNTRQKATLSDASAGKSRIEEKKKMVCDMGQRKDGPDWREANIALQQIMQDYAGSGPVREPVDRRPRVTFGN